jgi:hypothetical protein
MKIIVVRKENYVVGPLLRDLLATKFIVVEKGKSVLLQRYLFVIKLIAVSRGTLTLFYSKYFNFPFSVQNLNIETLIRVVLSVVLYGRKFGLSY